MKGQVLRTSKRWSEDEKSYVISNFHRMSELESWNIISNVPYIITVALGMWRDTSERILKQKKYGFRDEWGEYKRQSK